MTLTPHPLLVPWSGKSRPVPPLPLWAVRPVQNLSACTTVHFTFTYTSTPPMGHTACTEPQCLYNSALYLYLYLYSPMDRTACTEPQCLYKGAFYLYLLFFQVEKLLFGSSCTLPHKFIVLQITVLICIKEQDVKRLANTSTTVITVA